MDRVTFATSSGIVWLALAVHFAAGLVSIVAGAIALSVAKGGWLHKQSVPEPVRIVPLLLVLAFAPIPFLFYWMWRVRVRGRLSGMVLGATQPR